MRSAAHVSRSQYAPTAQFEPMPMQNKQYYVVLLAGGPADIGRELRDRLMKSRNLLIKYHWEYDKEHQWSRAIPADVDFVIMLKDMMGHQKYEKAKAACKRAGVRWILTTRKQASMSQALLSYGIRKSPPLPLAITSTAAFFEEQPEPETKKELAERRQHVDKLVKAWENPPEPVPAPTPATTVNIMVGSIPDGVVAETRRGTPSSATAILIAALYQKAQDDGISIMITPTSINIEPSK